MTARSDKARGQAGQGAQQVQRKSKHTTAKPYRVTVRGTRMRIWGEFADGVQAGEVCQRLRRLGLDAVVEREAK